MRFSNRKAEGAGGVVGGFTRSGRNEWVKEVEPFLREAAPLPISYDVDSTQPPRFTEYSYTEFLGGLLINTQSVEINTRLIAEASGVQHKKNHLSLMAGVGDKYELDKSTPEEWPKEVAFMVGHNMFDLVSPEIMARRAFENKDFYVKLHPLTNEEYSRKVAQFVGWDRIIPKNASGVELVHHCDTAHVSTATELASLAVCLGKKIKNISSFFHESSGIYYPINTQLFKSDNPENTLANIVDCPYSGVIFPWMEDKEERIVKYFEKTLEMRDKYGNISSPSRLSKN